MRVSIIINELFWVSPEAHQPFEPLSLQLGDCRTGLVGRNGSGKSTLLELLAGLRRPAGGYVRRNCRVAMLRQDLHGVHTIAELFGITEALAVLARAAEGRATLEELAEADWGLPTRLERCLQRFALDVPASQSLASLSGGQGTRARLAALLFQQPDFILLDEPSNHLDRDGRDQVMGLLRGWSGGALVASHDRELLDEMDAIVELGELGASRFGGNGTFYRQQKAAEVSLAEQAVKVAEKHRADLSAHRQQVAERQSSRDKAGRRVRQAGGQPKIVLNTLASRSEETSAAQARVTMQRQGRAEDQLREARGRVEILKPLSMTLPPTGLARGQSVLLLEDLNGGYAEKPAVINNVNLRIQGPERLALVGRNGSGKSTLLSMIAGVQGLRSGKLQVIPGVVLLDQKLSLLDLSSTVLDNFQRLNPGIDATQSRALLSRLQFRDESVLQNVHCLSGGQVMRVALACTIGNDRPARFLMLDEPTNHLDMQAQAVLESALQVYDGALLVVSHDERFLQSIGVERRIELG